MQFGRFTWPVLFFFLSSVVVDIVHGIRSLRSLLLLFCCLPACPLYAFKTVNGPRVCAALRARCLLVAAVLVSLSSQTNRLLVGRQTCPRSSTIISQDDPPFSYMDAGSMPPPPPPQKTLPSKLHKSRVLVRQPSKNPSRNPIATMYLVETTPARGPLQRLRPVHLRYSLLPPAAAPAAPRPRRAPAPTQLPHRCLLPTTPLLPLLSML